MSEITFARLATCLEAAGVEVGVAISERGHEIVLDGGDRRLRFPVTGSFDSAATLLTLSAALQFELVAQTPAGRLHSTAHDWPELRDLWASGAP